MTTTTPYMIRAIYDWCMDEGYTPHLLVDANQDDVVVPEAHIADGSIILNLSVGAVKELDLGNEWILFSARFGGMPMDITVPIRAVRAIYAKENGEGCGFPAPAANAEPSEFQEYEAPLEEVDQPAVQATELSAVDTKKSSKDHSKDKKVTSIKKPPKKGRPDLKLVD